jgi:hypothetical protein
MLKIDDHYGDAYLSDFVERKESGDVSPLERANAALLNADLARLRVEAQGDDLDKAQAQSVCERVAMAASACARAERIGSSGLADAFAKAANSEALVLSTLPYTDVSA